MKFLWILVYDLLIPKIINRKLKKISRINNSLELIKVSIDAVVVHDLPLIFSLNLKYENVDGVENDLIAPFHSLSVVHH